MIKIFIKYKKKIKKNPKVKKMISNFEEDLNPEMCLRCQKKIKAIKGKNIIVLAQQGRFFCPKCNQLIIKKVDNILKYLK